MAFYSKEATLLVYDQVNRDNPGLPSPLTPSNSVITKAAAAVSSNGRNTRATFTRLPGSGMQGSVTVYYDRINLTKLFEFSPLVYLPDTVSTTVNIYRDTKDISAAALPAPIATLTNGETEWRDTTAVNGQTYYYLATVTANGKTVAGTSQKYTVAVQRGIGPMGFISGDDELGYMGVVPYDERWLPSQMPAGLLSMYPTAFTDRIELYKFSRHGRILYTLGQSVIGSLGFIDWASLYQAGLVFGRDDAGPEGANGTLPATPQDAKILHKGDVYRMRLPRGLTDNDQSPVFPFNAAYDQKNHDDFPELTGFNEYNDLYYTMTYDSPEKKRWSSWNHLSPGYLGSYSAPVSAAYFNGGVLCMERDSANERVLHRGIFNNEGSAISTSASVMQRINYRARSWQGRYLPIFELVE